MSSTKQAIHTASAPAALGPYSQAIRAPNIAPTKSDSAIVQTIYCSGQIGLDPATGNLREGIDAQIEQSFRNLSEVASAAGATLNDAVKLTLFLTDLAHFGKVNAAMTNLFAQPYPARSTVQVAALPKGAFFEVEAVLVFAMPAR